MPTIDESLPDALADALGVVISDLRKQWKREMETIAAEGRAAIAEVRADVVALVADLRSSAAAEREKVSAALASVKDGEPGKDADPDEVARLVQETVTRAVEALPKPEMPSEERIAEIAAERIGAALRDLPEMPELPDVSGMIEAALIDVMDAEQVRAYVDEARNGIVDGVRSMIGEAVLTREQVEEIADASAARAVAELPEPVLFKSFVIDRAGHLIATWSDGATVDCGEIVGRDADMQAIERRVEEFLAAIPKPRDGEDGVGFDDLDMGIDERGCFLRFVRGETVKEFRLPVPIDCGVFSEGRTYAKGNGVSFGGCFWIAQEDGATEKPGTGKAWRLATKKGRDGKDGKLTAPKPQPVVKV